MRPVSPAILAALLVAAAAPAHAAVRAQAREEPQNTSAHTIKSQSSFNSGTLAQADLDTDIGFVSAGARTSAGSLSGLTQVNLSTGNPYAAGAFTAIAQASIAQGLTIGNNACGSLSCTSWSAIGVNSILLDFRIRASGGVSAFALDNRFDRAFSSIDYNWSLQAASGGGSNSRSETGAASGGINSQTGRILVRPGDRIDLNMAFTLFSSAALGGFANSGFSSAAASSQSNFSHTLEWDGITGITALDSNGDIVALTPDVRTTLLDDDGLDFWNSAASFNPPTTGVPEPASWAMLILGFGLTGTVMRRRTHRAVAA
jgi:hypothetical protein